MLKKKRGGYGRPTFLGGASRKREQTGENMKLIPENCKNYMRKIEELYVFVSSDESGEGIIGEEMVIDKRVVFMPFVAADKERIKSLRPRAEAVCKATKKKVKLLKFSHRTEIEEFKP